MAKAPVTLEISHEIPNTTTSSVMTGSTSVTMQTRVLYFRFTSMPKRRMILPATSAPIR
jgi:hypothetical protein